MVTKIGINNKQLENSICSQQSTDITKLNPLDTRTDTNEKGKQINAIVLKDTSINKNIYENSVNAEESFFEKTTLEHTPDIDIDNITKRMSDQESFEGNMTEAHFQNLPPNPNKMENKIKTDNDDNLPTNLETKQKEGMPKINDEDLSSNLIEFKNESLKNIKQIFPENFGTDSLYILIGNELNNIILNIDEKMEGIRDLIKDEFIIKSEQLNLEVKSSNQSNHSSVKEIMQTATKNRTQADDSSTITIEHPDNFTNAVDEDHDVLEIATQNNQNNVSEVFYILEESDDDRNKKVTFFDTNIGNLFIFIFLLKIAFVHLQLK